jgi:ubiquinone/menaquinone biosynthesis C-methylase UbiE
MQNHEYWNDVWSRDKEVGSYSYIESRMERALDKIGYFIQNGIDFKPNEKILEAGCGDGLILLGLLRFVNIEGYGLDFSEVAKKRAQSLMKQEKRHFDYKIGNVESLPYEDNFFDKIISLGVIEHFHDPKSSINEMYRTLKPGGTLILMTPNKYSLGVVDRLFKEMFKKWRFGYQTEYSPNQLSELVIDANFEVTKHFSNLRRSMEKDSKNFKVISMTDQFLNVIFKNWGFYSYVIATKSGDISE